MKLSKDILEELDNEIDTYCESFTFDDLLEIACLFREFKTKLSLHLTVSWNILNIVAGTLLIKKVLSGHHGDTNEKNNEFLIQFLIKSLFDYMAVKNSEILLNEDYGNLFLYSQVKNRVKFIPIYSSELNEYYILIPKVSWGTYLKNLELGGANISRRSKIVNMKKVPEFKYIIPSSRKGSKNSSFDQTMIRLLEVIYNSFHFNYFDSEMFAFTEIDIDNEILRFFSELTFIALERFPMLNQTSVVRIPRDEFFEIANKYKYDSNNLFNIFVSTKDNIKNFPIMVAHKQAIILSPETMFLLNGVFQYKLNKDCYASSMSGDVFEYEVEEELKKIGFSINDQYIKDNF